MAAFLSPWRADARAPAIADMLRALTLSDFVLVDHLALDFEPGFSVLTGETGAGKSILLDALSLVLGARAETGVVREGAARAEVAAEFDIAGIAGVTDWLEESGLDGEDDVLLLRRVVEASGRSRAFVNGRPATAQQLQAVGEKLVDIHGQHAHYSLLKAAEQRRLLDAWAGCLELASDTARAFRAWREAVAEREHAERHAGEADAERERLAWTERELAALEFSPEGWAEAQDTHRRLAHAAELLAGARAVCDQLEADEAGILARLRVARGELAELAGIDASLSEPLALMAGATDGLNEVARDLSRYADRVDLDPQALEQAEARVATVQAAARKYRLRPEDIPDHLRETRERLARLGAAADLDGLARREAGLAADYDRLARDLGRRRAASAAELARAVTAVMRQLAMKGGAFAVALTPREAAAHGLEEIEFQVAPHAGQGVKPLARTASGGELSRIGLALQTVLSGVSGAPTLVFDEVDAGIGGGVAEIVGRLLAGLGGGRQVLCVTHLAQVAARADHHYRVSKGERDGRAVSAVIRLDRDGRVEELARMAGGVEISDATRAHAARMLEGG